MKNTSTKIILKTLILILFIASTFTAKGQTTAEVKQKYAEFGIRFMPTFTSLRIKSGEGNNVKGEVTLGFGIGALLAFNFTQHIGVQAEIIYNSISQKSSMEDVEQKINLRYVNIPLLLSLNTGKSKPVNLNLVAGLQMGFKTGSSLTTSGNSNPNNAQPVLSVKKNDVGFAYGAGFDFGLNTASTIRLGIGYRGVLGLLNVANNNQTTTTDTYYILDRTHIKTNSAYAGLTILF